MLRRFGVDVVGMSTVPEVVLARHRGMQVVAASVVTNIARPDRAMDDGVTDGEEVCRAAATAADGIWAIIRQLLR
jgi:purine-nucleoside phosphorylase